MKKPPDGLSAEKFHAKHAHKPRRTSDGMSTGCPICDAEQAAESVEGKAGGEAWTFRIRPEDSKHGYFEVEIDGPHDDLSQMIQPPWGEPMVPESSLNAALARAEEAEKERDEWKERCVLDGAESLKRIESAEAALREIANGRWPSPYRILARAALDKLSEKIDALPTDGLGGEEK